MTVPSAGPSVPADRAVPAARLADVVAQAADHAELGATAPVLLMEIQGSLGTLATMAVGATARGRAPFRPDPQWAGWLARLAFDVFNLADQTGVDLEAAVRQHAESLAGVAPRTPVAQDGWPFAGD